MVEKQLANLKMIAWEVTRSCNLACSHCRASSEHGPYANELSTQEFFNIMDEVATIAKPIIILTGGEPLLRKDIFEIAAYGAKKGFTMVMSPNGTLLTDENIRKIMASRIKRISISLDGRDSASHDGLRKVKGAFEQACAGVQKAKAAGLEFQINSTITKRNIKILPQMISMVKELGAKAHHIFLLVPTGRAKDLVSEELSVAEYEEALGYLAKEKKSSNIDVKITCAPHFNRILLQQNYAPASALTGRGCMGGVSFCFISHVGDLQPCGYLELDCGNVRKEGFKKAWFESEVFNNIRDWGKYEGKCGVCEFKSVCGGCRARAQVKFNNYLGEEPYCAYTPKASSIR